MMMGCTASSCTCPSSHVGSGSIKRDDRMDIEDARVDKNNLYRLGKERVEERQVASYLSVGY